MARAIAISLGAAIAAAVAVLIAAPAEGGSCRGCGCDGGPGYRSPAGRCASWRNMGKLCGRPPETRCTAEQVNPAGPGSRRRRRLTTQHLRPTTIVPNLFR